MRALALAVALLLPFQTAKAQEVDPILLDAIAAADSDDWDTANSLAATTDTLGQDLITWMQLRAGVGDFANFAAFTAKRPDWPGMAQLREKGEAAIVKGADPSAVVAWFGDTAPLTGSGVLRLAEALMITGQRERAREVLAEGWLTLRLSDTEHDDLIAGFGDILAPHHAARTDALLWRWRTTDARRMLPLLDEGQAALAAARIAFISKSDDRDALLDAVPSTLRDAPGLAYDRYNYLSDQGERTEAVALLKARSVSAEALGDPFRWSGWRRALARWEMRDGRPDSAYVLATRHFLTEGEAFADLEWLAGYIALTYKGDANLALRHFERVAVDVESPISEGRAGYWIGRAYEAMGDANAAAAAYAGAAQHQTGFYGLLASEKLGLPLNKSITGVDDPRDWEEAPFLQEDMTRAALALLNGGERGAAVLFFVELGKTLERHEISQLGALLSEMEETYFEVVLGKTAATRDIIIPSVYFPLHPLKDMDLPVPASLALSIARRESEFNAGVGSPVGALGLMQLMPATAQEVAGFLALPYSRPRLTSDWEYNATLGAKYLAMLTEQFGPSPVQIAAGYNAGPSRPERWMDERGDPRLGQVDVVDWIEHIPFRETRNYVMRVTESIPVYEARLTGTAGPVTFTRLLNGAKPIVRPVARQDVAAPPAFSTSDAPAVAPPAPLARPTAVPGIRPIARPGG